MVGPTQCGALSGLSRAAPGAGPGVCGEPGRDQPPGAAGPCTMGAWGTCSVTCHSPLAFQGALKEQAMRELPMLPPSDDLLGAALRDIALLKTLLTILLFLVTSDLVGRVVAGGIESVLHWWTARATKKGSRHVD